MANKYQGKVERS